MSSSESEEIIGFRAPPLKGVEIKQGATFGAARPTVKAVPTKTERPARNTSIAQVVRKAPAMVRFVQAKEEAKEETKEEAKEEGGGAGAGTPALVVSELPAATAEETAATATQVAELQASIKGNKEKAKAKSKAKAYGSKKAFCCFLLSVSCRPFDKSRMQCRPY